MNIPLTRPLFSEDERHLVCDAIESKWVTQGHYVFTFERAVQEYLGAKHAVACSNGTSALHLALLAHQVGAGHEVIVPSYTWIATANVVRMVGATPVFVDIDDTLNLDPLKVEAAVTPRTRAIMPVHQFGLPCDMDRIQEIARRRQLLVIEDAACALGSEYKGTRVGALGSTTCFSFHPRKLITTGEGGMLITEDDALAAKVRVLLNHGASVSDLAKHKSGTVAALLAEEFHEVGYNYRMTNLQGALGTAQMKRLEHILRQRRFRAAAYSEAFLPMTHILPPVIPDTTLPNWQSYAIRVSDGCPVSRNQLAQFLLDNDIACRPAYMACHKQPAYSNYPAPDLYHTEKALDDLLLLPLYPDMTEDEQAFVIQSIQHFIKA